MRVMKFGGGCLCAGEDIRRAAARVTGPGDVLVVSALAGVTHELEEILERTAARKGVPRARLRRLVDRHRRILEETGNPGRAKELDVQLRNLDQLLTAVACLGETPASVRARVLGSGERLAAIILAAALENRGLPAAPCGADRFGIAADRHGTDARIDMARTRLQLRRRLAPLFRRGRIPVITGFLGRAPDGTVALFGRNGSDYSAAAVACALNARELVIWKSVDGIMTMDPAWGRARPVPRLSWEEAGELTHFGARILHPLTLEPLRKCRTRVSIRNIHRPDRPGTEITAQRSAQKVCGITCHTATTVLHLGIPAGGLQRALFRLGEILGVPSTGITSLVTARDRITLVMPAGAARKARDQLAAAADPDIRLLETRDDHALVAVVGRVLRHPRGLAELMDALAGAGITLKGLSPGASPTSLCLLVPRHQAGRCLQAIHHRFFPGSPAGEPAPRREPQ